MSANVDLVRSVYAAWECGDFSSTDWADPEIEFVVTEGLDAGSWRGLQPMAKAWRNHLRAWEDWRNEAEEYRELDDERVLVLGRRRGRGKSSGLEIGDMRPEGAIVFHIRGGRVCRLVLYADRDRALADLGLAPEGDSP